MVKIKLNGKDVEAKEGQTVLEAATANNIIIPTLCHYRALEPYGACRLCTVEIKKGTRSKLMTACTVPVSEGLEVETENEKVNHARKVILELLLARCPGSESLKEFAKEYGVDHSRFKTLSEPEDNCILCGLCVRTCQEIMGVGALCFGNRGADREVTKPFNEISSVCTTCGACENVCPTDAIHISDITDLKPQQILSEFNQGLSGRNANYMPYPQSVPNKAVIDKEHCMHFLTGTCGACKEFCEVGAVDFEQQDDIKEFKVGAVVVATGYKQLDLSDSEYNLEHPNVITGLELERLLNSTGPTEGKVRRPSDGNVPESITFIQCAGSRDERHCNYCSKICCMYTTKNAGLIRKEYPDMEINICYIDFRAAGRSYEEYYRNLRNMGVNLIRGRPSEILDAGDGSDGLVFDVFDMQTCKLLQIRTDMVILATALEPSDGTKDMISTLHLVYGPDGFIKPVHVKIAPVDTPISGLYIAGTATGPKPIQECITDASAAASRVASFLKSSEAEVDLDKASINTDLCMKCGLCVDECNYDAIDTTGDEYKVIEVACQSCGKCAALCPTNAIDLRQFLDEQITAQVDGILEADDKNETVIAFTCTWCGYNAADIAGVSRYDYPTNVKIVKFPCTGRMSFEHMLYPFTKGAKGVMVVGCLPEQCHYIDGNIGAKDRAQRAKEILDLIGIGGHRLEFFNLSSAMGDKFRDYAKRMVEQC